jgi:hypothetical protein
LLKKIACELRGQSLENRGLRGYHRYPRIKHADREDQILPFVVE